MTPEEALNNLTQLAYYYADDDEYILNNAKKYYDIIEKELKRLEEYDKTEYSALIESHKKLLKEKKDNEKKLKALEIIKEKRVNVDILIHYLVISGEEYALANYNSLGYCETLTQEEYDLLKEVLNNYGNQRN